MIRAVLDTNVVVSALLFRGTTSHLVTAWQTGRFRPVVSRNVLLEYAQVLAYPKFRLTMTEVRALLEEALLPFVETIQVGRVRRVVREDPADDEFLACAHAAKVDVLVSGDEHLLALERHDGIPILGPSAFMEWLKSR